MRVLERASRLRGVVLGQAPASVIRLMGGGSGGGDGGDAGGDMDLQLADSWLWNAARKRTF